VARTVTIVSGDVGKLFDQSGGFVVGEVKVLHDPEYGVWSPRCDKRASRCMVGEKVSALPSPRVKAAQRQR